MSLIAYITPAAYIPNTTHVNAMTGLSYLAWQLGFNQTQDQALWVIYQVRTPPTVAIGTILPVSYTEITLLDDVTKYGFSRVIANKDSIAALETDFLEQVDIAIQDVIDGYR